MKKTLIVLPIMLAAALATSACAKHDESTNTLTVNGRATNDDGIADGNVAGTDPFANDTPDNNSAAILGNGQ